MRASVSDAIELREELENDLALAMIIERRHARKIGSEEARELIERIKAVLGTADEHNTSDQHPHNLSDRFPFH